MVETAFEPVGRAGEGVDVGEGGVDAAGADGGEAVGGFGGPGAAGALEGGEAREVLEGAVHAWIEEVFCGVREGEGWWKGGCGKDGAVSEMVVDEVDGE